MKGLFVKVGKVENQKNKKKFMYGLDTNWCARLYGLKWLFGTLNFVISADG